MEDSSSDKNEPPPEEPYPLELRRSFIELNDILNSSSNSLFFCSLKLIESKPKVQGATPYLSSDLNKILTVSEKIAKDLKDEFVLYDIIDCFDRKKNKSI